MKQSLVGLSILRYLASSGFKIFTIQQAQQIAEAQGFNRSYVVEAFYHLQKGNWIVRLKRGVYAFSIESGFGVVPHEFEIAMALVTPCAISHWTAMHHHHLTQQTPNTIFAITPAATSIPRSISKNRYHFIRIKKEHYFGLTKTWIGQSQIQITDPERTLLDGLMTPQYCGDFQEVVHAFKMYGHQIDLERIIHYALKLDQSVGKRLGWILEKLEVEEVRLKDLLCLPIKGYRKLDPSGPLKGSYNKKWKLQENMGV